MTDKPTSIVVSASVVAESDEHATRAAEVLSRAVVGLALDGIFASMSMSRVEDDE